MLGKRLFRLGPVLLLPPVVAWAAVCNGIGSGEADDWWRIYPIVGALVVAVLWHSALVCVERDKLHYAAYALGHLPIFCLAASISLIHATRFPL